MSYKRMMDPVLEDLMSGAAADLTALYDVARIKALLEKAAREGRAVSYSELILTLGFRFTRPKMRALCKTLDKIDKLNAENGAPALAVLVVREGDRLPGHGWWIAHGDYRGPWTGPEAQAYIREQHAKIFAYWQHR